VQDDVKRLLRGPFAGLRAWNIESDQNASTVRRDIDAADGR
jgi:hypothetical protein